MNAAVRPDQVPVTYYSIKSSIIKSCVFHVLVFGLVAFGLPFVAKDPGLISNPINVEIIDIADITQTNRAAPPKKKAEELKPAPPKEEKPEPVASQTPPDLVTPKPPEPEKPVEKAAPKEEVPEPVQKKTEAPKPKPKKPKAKPKPPKAEPKQEDQFASLLKNLTPDKSSDEIAEDAPDVQEDSASPLSQIATLSDQLTISELDAFKQQIAPCWNVPSGAKYAEDIVVEIRVIMNRDRTVQSASILNKGRYNRESHFRAAADSAMRALRNPRCQPLRLPQDKYDQWKTILMRFDPRDML